MSHVANRVSSIALLRPLPGLLTSAGLAAVSVWVARLPWLSAAAVSPVVVATLLGIVAANVAARPLAALPAHGFELAREPVLKLAIVLYALRIPLAEMRSIGPDALLLSVFMAVSTMLLAWYAGRRWLGLDATSALLIGAGSSICGTAAVLATEGVLRSRSAHVGMAVAVVVLFGTIGMFLYPLLVPLVATLAGPGWDAAAQGVYVGATLHAVGQVVVAGSALGAAAAGAAVVTKMLRVCLLAPMLIVLALIRPRGADREGRRRIPVPWFAVAFVALALVHPWLGLPAAITQQLGNGDEFLLATAMASMGMTVQLRTLGTLGPRPLMLGGLLFVYLAGAGLALSILPTAL